MFLFYSFNLIVFLPGHCSCFICLCNTVKKIEILESLMYSTVVNNILLVIQKLVLYVIYYKYIFEVLQQFVSNQPAIYL